MNLEVLLHPNITVPQILLIVVVVVVVFVVVVVVSWENIRMVKA